MICLKSLTFVESITTGDFETVSVNRCDLLEKSYLCGINNNYYDGRHGRKYVVICLKSLTFVESITTAQKLPFVLVCCDLLEKSYLCGINNNTPVIAGNAHAGCDLLEKSYLCGINNNE